MGRIVMTISAGVTAFVLAITAGAIYTFRNAPASPAASTDASSSGATLEIAALPSPAQVANVSPQDAASIAAKFLDRTDLFSVELADFAGVQTYKVTFSSGDVVFVGMNGVVLSSVPPPAPTVLTITTGGGGGGGHHNGGGGGGDDGGGEGEHEGGGDD